jgi:hypothetical protein
MFWFSSCNFMLVFEFSLVSTSNWLSIGMVGIKGVSGGTKGSVFSGISTAESEIINSGIVH